ncbi:MAG: hypothetical protein M0Q00_03525 [Acholeplasmataceae bacterium]|nr:hypothetical protein [Acholeplasmataceae bacterium]
MAILIATLGHHEVIDNWLKDTIVGVITLVIIILLLYVLFRLTGLIKVKK